MSSPKTKPAPAKSITQEIQELCAMAVPELVARYTELHGKEPRSKHRTWLWRRCAHRLQEVQFGGLSQVAQRRLDELIAELDLPLNGKHTVRGKVAAKPGDPPPGTTLTRVWRGTEIHTTAVEGGWECAGVVYRSLSAAAKAVTGSHWNGRLFFGLKSRRRAR